MLSYLQTDVLLAISLICRLNAAVAFSKVVVPSVYNEWDNYDNHPIWFSNKTLRNENGYDVFLYQKLNSSDPNFVATNRGTEGI